MSKLVTATKHHMCQDAVQLRKALEIHPLHFGYI